MKIFLRDKYVVDRESATQTITVGLMKDREAFVNSLPMVICYEGEEGLEDAFREWLKEEKK